MAGDNIGHAILILGMIYYGFNYGYEWWTIGFLILASATWTTFGLYSEKKEKIKAEIELLKEKTRWYERRSSGESKT